MSIVYDYLKQIQAKKPAEKIPPVVPPVVPLAKTPPKFSFAIKVMAGVVLCLSVAAIMYFFFPKSEKTVVKMYKAPATASVAKTEKTDPGYVLEGIIYNPSRPFAIINGKMLETNSKIGDFEVAEITPDSVTLKDTKDNTSRTIRL